MPHTPFPHAVTPLEDAFENAPCGYLYTDAQGYIVRTNRTLCVWLKSTAEALTKLRLVDLLSVGSRFFIETNLWPLLKLGGEIREAAVDLQYNEQRMPVLMAANGNHPCEGLEPIYRVTLFPAWDRRQFELDLLAARKTAEGAAAQLERRLLELAAAQTTLSLQNHELAEAVQEKNKLLGMAAHDLRSPLGGIESLCGFVMEDADSHLSADARQFLSLISQSSHYMQKLVTDLLDYAKVQSGTVSLELQDTDVFALANESASMNRLLSAKKQIQINVKLVPNEPPRALVDRNKMKQVLNNLLSNAVKFSMPGRHVDLIVESCGPEVVVTVADRGQGIPEAEQLRLFRPFRLTSVKGTDGEPSTGLGLAIVKKIVTEHGGHVAVSSQVGVGSQFIVKLPLCRVSA